MTLKTREKKFMSDFRIALQQNNSPMHKITRNTKYTKSSLNVVLMCNSRLSLVSSVIRVAHKAKDQETFQTGYISVPIIVLTNGLLLSGD